MDPSKIAEAMREAAADVVVAAYWNNESRDWAIKKIRSIPIPDYSEWLLVPKDLVRQAYNAGWRQGEIEARPYSQGGVPWRDSDICAMIAAKEAIND